MALGAATKTDLLETRVRLSQAEHGLARTEHARALAEMNLRNLLGLTGKEELILEELPGVEKDFPLLPLAEATGTALECRKELAGLRYYLAIAEENLQMAKGFWKPTVALVGRYAEDQSKSPGFSDPTFTATLGLEVSLFSGGGKLAEVREKEAALEKVEYNYRQAVEGIKLRLNRNTWRLQRNYTVGNWPSSPLSRRKRVMNHQGQVRAGRSAKPGGFNSAEHPLPVPV